MINSALINHTAAGPVVEYGDPLQDARWDDKISHCPGVSIFHGSAWARVLADSYGFRPVYLLTQAAGAVRTLLPIMEVDSWLTGRRGVSLPFSDECEPLWTDATELQQVVDRAFVEAETRGWKYLECRSAHPIFAAAPPSACYFRHHLDLKPGTAALFANMDAHSRRAIRKAEKHDVKVVFGSALTDVRNFYTLHCRTRRRLGVPPQPWSFFRNIHRYVLASGNGIVASAYFGETNIAAALFFTHGRTALYKFAASSEAHLALRGNNLVLWRAIERFVEHGCEQLNMGRTAHNHEGLRRFKLSWGGSEEPLNYVTYRPYVRSFSSMSRTQKSRSRWLAMLPMPVARAIGAVLYKHVA